MLNLERMIQLSVDIAAHILSDYSKITSTTMGDTFTKLAEITIIPRDLAKTLSKAVGFRNLAVHQYKV